MSLRSLLLMFAWFAASMTACGGNERPSVTMDAGAEADLGSEVDLGDAPDLGGTADLGEAQLDASVDASTSGFGSIAGPCGRVAAELSDADPSYFLTRFDFMTNGYDDPDERTLLTDGAQQILADGTAGGSSGVSEALAFEVLARCEGATFVKSETEVVYDPTTSKKTDILVSIDGMRVGVSVTRAEAFPLDAPYTTTNAAFIERKLTDILESSMNVVEADRWVKQILVVMAYGDMHADSIRTVWEGLNAETRADTILYIVVTDGDDASIY